MTTDLNDVKAGKYQLVAVRWDQITSKPGEPLDYVRYHRGDIVDLNAEDAKRLVAAGAVVRPGQLERTKAEQARALAERAAAEYAAILAGLPEDVRAEVDPATVAATGTPSTTPTSPGGSSTASSGSATVDVVDADGKSINIDEIKKAVGDDKAKAQSALEAEQARGAETRSTLVDWLKKVVEG